MTEREGTNAYRVLSLIGGSQYGQVLGAVPGESLFGTLPRP